MLKARIIPCLLLANGRLVKTIKFKTPSYIGDPVNAIKIYNEKEVDELILVDIFASINNAPPDFKIISEVTNECFMPLAYGGGIKSIEHIKTLFSLGIEKIIINSSAIENPDLIKKAVSIFGSQSIVIAIDVKKSLLGKYTVCYNNGQKYTKYEPVEYAKKMEQIGVGEVFLNSIDRDGTWKGLDINMIKNITASISIPVIACGGAGSIQDIENAIKHGNASAVALGSMAVYQGKNLGVLINFPARGEVEHFL